MFSFDLKTGYNHHYEIFQEHTRFLGFSWVFGNRTRYFTFQVLPFGLSTAPYIFTKCLKPIVNLWRSRGIFIVLYLDDGWGRADSFVSCEAVAKAVKEDILEAGLVPNVEKSQWIPVQCLDWLGLTWDSSVGCIKITQRRMKDLESCLDSFQAGLPQVSARKIAALAGKINSLYPVVGTLTQLKSRFMHQEIIRRDHWDKEYILRSDNNLITELFFWKENLFTVNEHILFDYSIPQTIYSDASQSGCGAWVGECAGMKMVRNWTGVEMSKSSTWRELMSVSLALQAFAPFLRSKTAKVFTDNKGVVSIVAKGSMIAELHELSLDIFNFCRENLISLQVQYGFPERRTVVQMHLVVSLISMTGEFPLNFLSSWISCEGLILLIGSQMILILHYQSLIPNIGVLFRI